MAKDAPWYLPDEADVYYRANAVVWMSHLKWDVRVMDAVMYHDNPTIDTVERLVRQYGVERAYDILWRMTQ